MRAFALAGTFLLALLLSTYSLSSYAVGVTLFSTEQEAQQHCPHDEVVWVNLSTHIWHVGGSRWYANTENGAYVCKQEAAAAGARESLNG